MQAPEMQELPKKLPGDVSQKDGKFEADRIFHPFLNLPSFYSDKKHSQQKIENLDLVNFFPPMVPCNESLPPPHKERIEQLSKYKFSTL